MLRSGSATMVEHIGPTLRTASAKAARIYAKAFMSGFVNIGGTDQIGDTWLHSCPNGWWTQLRHPNDVQTCSTWVGLTPMVMWEFKDELPH